MPGEITNRQPTQTLLSWAGDFSGSIFYEERLKSVVKVINMKPISLSVFDFFTRIIGRSSPIPQTRTKFMKNGDQIGRLMNMIAEDTHGKEGLDCWLRSKNYARDLICSDIQKEMDYARPCRNAYVGYVASMDTK